MTSAEQALVAQLAVHQVTLPPGRHLNARMFVRRLLDNPDHDLTTIDRGYLQRLAEKAGLATPATEEAPASTGLLLYDAARQALAEARDIDEVRDWEDKAAAVREYARRVRNRQLEIDAAEIRVRAQRRRGELLAEMKADGILVTGPKKKGALVEDGRPMRVTLSDLDTTKDESANAQKLAAIAPDAFERLAARVRKRMEVEPEIHAFNVLRERDGPINGARSVMGSRVEPDDSLDYFPTPPWATRALIEHVLQPHLGGETLDTAWEPACGEGHIAEVLCEYFRKVSASDIHDYGYARVGANFLSDEVTGDVDWIVTNPPFGDKTEAFILKALRTARVGVAMFVRLQVLEGVGRYDRIFRDAPPTYVSVFAERVNLCKGRWDPDGTTATAYVWLVWIRGCMHRGVVWIPPGRREQLTRADDAERFTTQPVTKADHAPHDPETGEVAA